MEGEGHPMAEDVVRLLAAAANAARLYPPSSALPAEAVQRFVARANEVTAALGPLRYVLDPHSLRMGDVELAPGQGQVTALAEALHAMQVGQLLVAPGVMAEETVAFLGVANTDPTAVRQQGIRSMLVANGVAHIAVIEVSLRASTEEGILGLDLATAPLEDLASETKAAAETWLHSATEGTGRDDMAEAIGRLEEAARDIATQRVAEALLQLDEDSRMRVLAYSMRADSGGARMNGMHSVIARMKPAALARLLQLVAVQANTDPRRVAAALELPPEVAAQVALLLAPSPRTEAECGVPAEINAEAVVHEATLFEDRSDLERQISVASPALASGKGLATTVAVSRVRPTEDAVTAIAEALPRAARDGGFAAAREALRRLDELAADPALTLAVEQARVSLQDPEVLRDVCRAPISDADAAIAGEILTAAGATGAEALLAFYVHADERQRSLFRPVMRGMAESLLASASRHVRTDDTPSAVGIVRILPTLGDRRAIPVLLQALEHLDVDVRRAAVTALADMPGGEGKAHLAKPLGHWDPETRRFAVREIGRVRAAEALPALVRIIEDLNLLERNHELKKEVIKSLEAIGSVEALPVLKRLASRRFVLGRKNKELKFLAQRAVENVSRTAAIDQGVDAP